MSVWVRFTLIYFVFVTFKFLRLNLLKSALFDLLRKELESVLLISCGKAYVRLYLFRRI